MRNPAENMMPWPLVTHQCTDPSFLLPHMYMSIPHRGEENVTYVPVFSKQHPERLPAWIWRHLRLQIYNSSTVSFPNLNSHLLCNFIEFCFPFAFLLRIIAFHHSFLNPITDFLISGIFPYTPKSSLLRGCREWRAEVMRNKHF